MNTCATSVRLLLRRALELARNRDTSDAGDHEGLDAEQTDPDDIEDLLLVAAANVHCHLVVEHGVGAGDEEEDLGDVEGVPVGTANEGTGQQQEKEVTSVWSGVVPWRWSYKKVEMGWTALVLPRYHPPTPQLPWKNELWTGKTS